MRYVTRGLKKNIYLTVNYNTITMSAVNTIIWTKETGIVLVMRPVSACECHLNVHKQCTAHVLTNNISIGLCVEYFNGQHHAESH